MAAEQLPADGLHWRCSTVICHTLNDPGEFRCSSCNTIKPYLMQPSASSLLGDQPYVNTFSVRRRASREGFGPGPSSSAHYRSGQSSASCLSRPGGMQAAGGAFRKHSPEEPLDFPVKVCRLILLGKTGSGKSSTGNTIIGSKHYPVGRNFNSTTTKCWWHSTERFGVSIEVVDTPGFFDTGLDEVVVTKEIVKCVGLVAPGPHALLIVIRADVKFTEEEAKTVEHIRHTFGADIMRHMIIVFTHGDGLEGEDIREMLDNSPPALSKLLGDTYKRYVVFNNKETDHNKNAEQVKRLLLTVRGLLASTDNESFTNPFLLRCQETVMTHTTHLAEMLEKNCTSETVQDLIKTALAAGDNTQEVLHQVMDDRELDTSELRALKGKVESLEIDKNLASRNVDDANRRLKRLKEENTLANSKAREAREKLRALEADKDRANEEISKTNKLLQQLTDESANAKKSVSDAEKKLRQLEGEKAEAKRNANAYQAKAKTLNITLKKAQDLNKDLQAQLKKEQEKGRCFIL